MVRHTRKHSRKSHRKHTRKASRGAMKWTSFVSMVHKQMKKRNPNAKLGDAMKEASRRKKEM